MKKLIEVAVFDTKPYDRFYLEHTAGQEDIRWQFHEFQLSEKTVEIAKGAEVVCVSINDQLDKRCLEALANLKVKLITLRCTGYNHVDINAAESLFLPITYVPFYSPHSIAEHSFGLLICLNRKIHQAYYRIKDNNFSLNGLLGFDLAGKTMGIIGTGKIGKIVAQIAKGFDAKVIAFDTSPQPDWSIQHEIGYVTLSTLLMESDIISVHVPLSPNTLHLINAEAIRQTKPGVVIINTSRGKIIEMSALIEGLKSKHIGGVALDIHEEEETVFSKDGSLETLPNDEINRLLNFPNVLITAHQGFFTHESLTEIAKITVENILRLARKEAFLPETIISSVTPNL